MNRRTLILDGAQAATDVREQLGLDLIAPVDPYAIAEALGIRVRFLPVSCGSAWKKDPGSGVIGVEKGPLIPVV